MRKRRPPRKRSAKPVRDRLTIEGLSAEGQGVSGDLQVPFALPGETVEALVSGKSARVVERFGDAAERHPPLCPHFGRPGDACGGCTLQHLGAEAVLTLKKAQLLSAVRTVFPEAELDAVSTSPQHSRRRCLVGVSPERIGFRALGDRTVVALKSCEVVHPELFEELQPLRALARQLNASFDAQLTRVSNGIDTALSGINEAELSLEARETLAQYALDRGLCRLSVGGVCVAERDAPLVHFGGVPVEVPPGAFLQATEAGEAALVSEVQTACTDARMVADLFAGLGTFSLPLSQHAEVLAVDSAGEAITRLEKAAKRSGRPVTALSRDLFKRPLLASELGDFDAVVFDPPRAGAGMQAGEIAAAGPDVVVAVSCNPRTLARDLAAFAAAYDLTRLVLVDQFAWSPHIEVVAVLRRR